jgi:hypothetical protein
MTGAESASVRAGGWMYLFFNRDDKPQIDFWKVAEESRDPKPYQIKVDGNAELSLGGAITAVYLEQKDEIHVYYIGKPPAGKKVPLLKEVCLKNASSNNEPANWTEKDMDLNKKGWKIDGESMLCSAVDSKGYPRVFYNEADELTFVNYAEFGDIKGGGKDWTTTRFTGLSS